MRIENTSARKRMSIHPNGRHCYNPQTGEHRRSVFSAGDGAHGKEEVSGPQAPAPWGVVDDPCLARRICWWQARSQAAARTPGSRDDDGAGSQENGGRVSATAKPGARKSWIGDQLRAFHRNDIQAGGETLDGNDQFRQNAWCAGQLSGSRVRRMLPSGTHPTHTSNLLLKTHDGHEEPGPLA